MKHRPRPCHVLVLAAFICGPVLSQAADSTTDLARSWRSYLEGRKLFEERRFGEALVALQRSIRERMDVAERAKSRIDAILETKDVERARDSISALLGYFAEKDITEREQKAIEAEAGESLVVLARLYATASVSSTFSGFLDSLLLLVRFKPGLAEANSIAALGHACEALGDYPEAEAMIGRIYLAEGELRLAELQFMKALDMRESFEVPEDRFPVLEEIAAIYRDQRRFPEYEERLREIEVSGTVWQARQDFLRAAMERTLVQEGFDRYMILYRLEEGAATDASLELGEYYLDRGRSAQALGRLLVATNILSSRMIARIGLDDPEYVFTTLGILLDRVGLSPELRMHAEEAGFFRALTLLGEALWFQGQARDKAQYLWRALARRSEAGEWGARAARDLVSPPRPVTTAP